MNLRRSLHFAALLSTVVLSPVYQASAQTPFKVEATTKGPRLGETLTQKLKVGVVITAKGGPCKGITASVPVPTEWAEQHVQIVQEDLSATVKPVEYQMIGGTVKHMQIEIPFLPAGEEAHALVTFEVTRHMLLAPESTSEFEIPKKLPRDVMIYLGPSPFIESRNAKIISAAKTVVADKENAWAKVEAIYDWVRETVTYENGELKGALRALNDKTGDCEELSSLFIAMCRSQKIPARTVWVLDHCYPEFYLVDAEGKGYWFPCQAAGSRAFGGIPDQHPILQKGDNFRDPEDPKKKMRYLGGNIIGESFKGGGRPKCKFVLEKAGI